MATPDIQIIGKFMAIYYIKTVAMDACFFVYYSGYACFRQVLL
jgi:hypothetical protein